MASEDQLVNCNIKIEIDVADDPYPPSFGSQHLSECTCDETERSVKSATTSESDCWNPSAAAMKPEPDSQPAGGQGIKAEPDYDIGEDGDQGEESEQRTFSDSDVRTSDIEFSDSADEKVPMKTKKEHSRTRQPSSSDRPRLNSNTSGTPLPLNRSHVCQHCFAAFGQFNSLKLHAAVVHSEKLQAVDKARDSVEGEKTTKGKKDTVGGRTTVETEKNKVDDTDTDRINLGKNDRRHVCDVCNKAFTQAGHLKTHLKIHSGEKAFVCDVCSKAFTQAGHLKTHLKIHSGEKAFVCDVCSKAFTQAGNLKTHLKIHSGEKAFVCDVCSKAFTRAGNLKTHLKIHSGEKAFVCDVCSKAFTVAYSLKTHKRIHTGERPYKCPHCDVACNQSSDLQKHSLRHSLGLMS